MIFIHHSLPCLSLDEKLQIQELRDRAGASPAEVANEISDIVVIIKFLATQ